MFSYVLTQPEVAAAVAAVTDGLHNAKVSPNQTSIVVPNLTPNRKINKTPNQGRQTNLLPSPGTKPSTQGRQTNLLPSPGTKPIPKVVKQTCCPLEEPNPLPKVVKQTCCHLEGPNPYPRSSNKLAALSRNQTHTQGRQTNLLPSPGTKPLPKNAAAHFTDWTIPTSTQNIHSYYFFQCPVTSSTLRPASYSAPYSFSLSLSLSSLSVCCSINMKKLVSHSYNTETQNVGACQAHLRHYRKSTLSDSTDSLHIPLQTTRARARTHTHAHTHTHTDRSVAEKMRHKFSVASRDMLV